MANRYASAPSGTILVPTPNGLVPMTLADARAYQATHQYGATDPANPNLTPQLRQQIQDPKVQQALQSGASTTVQVGDTKFRVENGQLTSYSVGGIWKPLAAAAAVGVTAGLAGAAVAGAGPFAAGGAGTAGATGTSGASAAAGGAGSTAGLTNVMDPWYGLAPSGGGSSVLKGVGSFLGSAGGGAAINAGANLLGAGIAASGQTKAAEIQAQYLREALAYEKQRDAYLQQLEAARYGDISRRLEPYQAQATTTGDALAKLLGVNPASYQYGTPEGAASSSMGPPVPMPSPLPPSGPMYQTRVGLDTTQAPVGTAMPRPGSPPATPPSGSTVLMRAPDGSTKHVPADAVSHYQSRGAQVVSG